MSYVKLDEVFKNDTHFYCKNMEIWYFCRQSRWMIMYVKCLLLLNVKRIILFTVKQKSFVLYYNIDNTVQFTHTCDYSHTCSSLMTLTSLVSASLRGARVQESLCGSCRPLRGLQESLRGLWESSRGMKWRGCIEETFLRTTSCALGVAHTYVSEVRVTLLVVSVRSVVWFFGGGGIGGLGVRFSIIVLSCVAVFWTVCAAAVAAAVTARICSIGNCGVRGAGRGCGERRGCSKCRGRAERRFSVVLHRRRTFTSSNRLGALLFLGDLLGGKNSSGVARPCQKLRLDAYFLSIPTNLLLHVSTSLDLTNVDRQRVGNWYNLPHWTFTGSAFKSDSGTSRTYTGLVGEYFGRPTVPYLRPPICMYIKLIGQKKNNNGKEK